MQATVLTTALGALPGAPSFLKSLHASKVRFSTPEFRLDVPWGVHLRTLTVRTGSWTGPPRGGKAPRVGISSTVGLRLTLALAPSQHLSRGSYAFQTAFCAIVTLDFIRFC